MSITSLTSQSSQSSNSLRRMHGTPPDAQSAERLAFQALLHPEDSYDDAGTYWADMGLWRRLRFVTRVNAKETKRELGTLSRMSKKDPLEPIREAFRSFIVPGAGLGLEGYVLFSIGNIKPLFNVAWPTCWGKGATCNSKWIESVEYLEITGIIIGQILVGIMGDWAGRRYGLIQDATIMFLGLVMLTASWGMTLEGWVICYAISLFIYGIGVGGEYPMTATSGMENATGSGRLSTKEDRLHRGRKVTLAFLMQGWGQFFNQAILIILLLIFNHHGDAPYTKWAVQWTFRLSFLLPAIGTLWLVYHRAYRMPEASRQLNDAKKKSSVTGYDTKSLKLTFKYFTPRLIATCGAWFANDVFFYGNKLFQGEFIKVISPNSHSVLDGWLWNLLNVGVSLFGYHLASMLIDNKLYGRKQMQIIGFMITFICFIIPAFNFAWFTEPSHIKAFQALYFLSSFFNQFGPNSVTFLVAAEVFPTPVRATAHGLSAAIGKLGALLASVLYSYIDTQTKFYVVPWFGLAGAVLTLIFLPDTTGLDLKEQERRWRFLCEGRESDYHGVAVHSKHLSAWERWRGVGKHYDSRADWSQRVEELRGEWLEQKRRDAEETERDGFGFAGSELTPEVIAHFERTYATSEKKIDQLEL